MKLAFDKGALDLEFGARILGMQIVPSAEAESVYLMTQESGDLKIVTEKDKSKEFQLHSSARLQLLAEKSNRMSQVANKVAEGEEINAEEEEE
mmetsp:Transcript_5196/g.3897  ORF Transcript_5196/g.3897 Transcript_5196/m.3897 type:complete len:93 (-) Transcript_5196:2994-3272(-)